MVPFEILQDSPSIRNKLCSSGVQLGVLCTADIDTMDGSVTKRVLERLLLDALCTGFLSLPVFVTWKKHNVRIYFYMSILNF